MTSPTLQVLGACVNVYADCCPQGLAEGNRRHNLSANREGPGERQRRRAGHTATVVPLQFIGGEIRGTWPFHAHISIQVSMRA